MSQLTAIDYHRNRHPHCRPVDGAFADASGFAGATDVPMPFRAEKTCLTGKVGGFVGRADGEGSSAERAGRLS
jgi:hypothetical protein